MGFSRFSDMYYDDSDSSYSYANSSPKKKHTPSNPPSKANESLVYQMDMKNGEVIYLTKKGNQICFTANGSVAHYHYTVYGLGKSFVSKLVIDPFGFPLIFYFLAYYLLMVVLGMRSPLEAFQDYMESKKKKQSRKEL